MPSPSNKLTGKTKIVKALPQDLASPLKKRKLDDLSFDDFNSIAKQLRIFEARNPDKFRKETGKMYTTSCGGCFCF